MKQEFKRVKRTIERRKRMEKEEEISKGGITNNKLGRNISLLRKKTTKKKKEGRNK